MKEDILKDFISKRETLDAFKERIINLLSDLLRQERIIIHHISGRTKEYESLSKKIDGKLGKYKAIDDITDLVGLRIISYLESDVNIISNLIRKEFLVDDANSIDKRKLNIDQFGYKSLHLVVSLNTTRSKLTEYKGYGEIKCEIQIRSILQHAWAEIEHDLGYKGKSSIPNQYKRNFNRLAALLETADIEFDRLKRELSHYESEVGELIRKTPEAVQIDQTSLAQFNLEDKVLIEARELLSQKKGWSFDAQASFDIYGITERFEFFEMHNIKDIEDSLVKDKKYFLAFLEEFTKDFDDNRTSHILVVLFYYQHFLVAKTENTEKISQYFGYSDKLIFHHDSTADRFVEIFKKIKNLN